MTTLFFMPYPEIFVDFGVPVGHDHTHTSRGDDIACLFGDVMRHGEVVPGHQLREGVVALGTSGHMAQHRASREGGLGCVPCRGSFDATCNKL